MWKGRFENLRDTRVVNGISRATGADSDDGDNIISILALDSLEPLR